MATLKYPANDNFVITNQGYVGIGTSNPSCPLNVKSNNNEPIAKFEGDPVDTIVLIQSNLSNGADEVGIAIKGDSAKEEYWFIGTEDVTNNDNSLHFAASNDIHNAKWRCKK